MRKFNLSVLRPGTSEEYSGFIDGSANVWGIKAKIQIKDEEIKLDLSGLGEAIVTLWLKPEEESLFPLLPGFMVGYNRPEDTGPYYPQIAPKQDMNHPNMLSPYWGIRADRATIPAAFLFGKNKCWAISVPPYIDNPGKKHTTNGLRVCLKRGVGISIGFINEPVHFVKSVYAPGSKEYHNFKGKTTVVCQYHQGLSNGRSGHAVFVKRLYKFFHEKGPKGDGLKATVKMVSDALVKDILIPAQTTLKKERFGEFFKIKDGKPAPILF
ncbi:MAG: hypothetical protein NTX32_03155 [Candidatus Firestonebacteria bacterium]|nr:hypothetical protein [Candidatus Firestonebacteria bacterium]